MSASLFDGFGQLINSGFGANIAKQLGDPEQHVSRGLQAASTSILAGLANKSGDPGTMKQVYDLIASPAQDIASIEDPAAFAESVRSGGGIAGMSSRFLSDLFGAHVSAVNDVVAKASGLSAQSVSQMMRFAVPLVLGYLGRHVRQGGLDLNSFTRLLSDEKNTIMRAAPLGLASAMGIDESRPSDREVPVQEVRRDSDREAEPAYAARGDRIEEAHGRPRWVWPTLAVVAALALFFTARGRRDRAVMNMDTTTATSGGEVAPMITPAPNVGGSTSVGATTSVDVATVTATPTVVRLPDGTVLAVVPTSIESRLAGFIVDSSRMTDKTTWFDFDRLRFASNSADLLPESQDQLRNVAKILAVYPNVSVKIGGYTDNVGDAAANKRLSKERAANVRSALIKAGVASDRLTSEGYGDAHPIADNSTEQGRAQNRRISVLVVKK
jgi:outer membrane protein OmpA-like peptidoglycan-associated protein